MSNTAHSIGRGIGKTIKWTILSLGALIIVMIVAMMISLGSAANKSDQSAKGAAAKMSHVHTGQTEGRVRNILGKPESTQSDQAQGLGKTDYWYYGVLAQGGYQLVFDNGHLTAINKD